MVYGLRLHTLLRPGSNIDITPRRPISSREATGLGVVRFPAQEIENLVTSQVHQFLASRKTITEGLKGAPERDVVAERASDLVKHWPQLDTLKQHDFVRNIVRRVVIGKTAIWIGVDMAKLMETLLGHKPEFIATTDEHGHDTVKLNTDFHILRRGNELHLVGAQGSCFERTPIPSLVKAIARARGWYEQIVAGEIGTVTELARRTGLHAAYVKRILQCAMLSPQIIKALLSGKQRANLTLQVILDNAAIDWRKQTRDLQLSSQKMGLMSYKK